MKNLVLETWKPRASGVHGGYDPGSIRTSSLSINIFIISPPLSVKDTHVGPICFKVLMFSFYMLDVSMINLISNLKIKMC